MADPKEKRIARIAPEANDREIQVYSGYDHCAVVILNTITNIRLCIALKRADADKLAIAIIEAKAQD